MTIVLRIQQTLWVVFGALAATTIALLGLSLKLSLELRAAELSLMRRIGGSGRTIRQMIAAEVSVVLFLAILIAAALCAVGIWLLSQFV